MTTPSTLTKFTLLTATLAVSMVLLSATGGARAHDYDRHDHSGYGDRDHDRDRDRDRDRDDHDHPPYHDNPIVVDPVHGPGSSHNPIVTVVRDHRGSGFQGDVRDHRGSGFQGDVRDHRGLNGAPGAVTVSGGGTVVPQPTCHYYCGHGGYGSSGHGGGGQSGVGFQGDVRDHRGQPTGRNNGSIPCYGDLCF
jgi:Ni/Co efflux regulator RcnB